MINEETVTSVITELIQNNIDKWAHGVTNLGKDTLANIKIKIGTAFKDYLTTATNKYSFTKTILYRYSPVHLYQFYVDIELESKDGLVQSSEIKKLLENNNKFLLIGTGGTGKSTLMKHLFLSAVESEKYIPIFIELREINDLEDITSFDLLDFMYQKISDFNFTLEKPYFMNAIKKGDFVFIFDGFDELKQRFRNTVSKQIVKISDKYTNNFFIVSSRPDRNFVTWNNFPELKMKPLSKKQCLQLIDNLEYDLSTKENFKKILDKRLYNEHETFLSNPLLLTIMLMTYSQSADIPEKLCVFYEQAFNALYSHHDAIKEGGFKRFLFAENMPIDTFKDIISLFSIQSYMRSQTHFTDKELNEYLENAKRILKIEYDVKLVKKDIINSVCLLLLDGDKYVFTHRSFQEYFTAYYVSRATEDVQKKLLDALPKFYYNDIVFNLLFEMMRERVEKYFIFPHLTRIFEESGYSPECVKDTFLKNIFSIVSSVNIDIGKEDGSYDITLVHDDRQKGYGNTIGLINYASKCYAKIYSKFYGYDYSIPNRKQIYMRYFPNLTERITLSPAELLSIVETKENFISLLELDFIDYSFTMKILPLLLKESKEKQENIESIIFG
ncbi:MULTISPECIES: NACHT domain-containing protein [unclassified Paenibacillus]|uniref:NACHT domain-containing protein n=1 Tax=unclassified Paenibacillus TaxID=185978 RepID=UPI00362D6365